MCVAAVLAAGCESRAPLPSDGSAPVMKLPEPPTATVGSAQWLDDLPKAALEIPIGTRVWATVPMAASELVSVGIYTLDSVDDGAVTLVDKLGTRTHGVAPALVHALRPSKGLEVGDTALFFTWTTPAALGRVTRKNGAEVRIRYDWAGETKDTAADHAEPLRKGVAPFAYVTFPKFGRQSLGLVVALDASFAWLRTSSGHVEKHARGKLAALEVASAPLKVGAKVRAYAWVDGFRDAVVQEIVEPGLRYAVRPEGAGSDERYFFTALSPRASASASAAPR